MKNDAAEEAALGLLGLHANGAADLHSRPAPTVPLKRKSFAQPRPPLSGNNHKNSTAATASNNSDAIRCICGFDYDDGFSVACDVCGRWVHAACFDIVDGEVPEEFRCWVCEPRPVNKEKAVKLQKARQKYMQDVTVDKQRRRISPGVERKGRKTSDGTGTTQAKRKRRTSVVNAPPHTEDELIDIDEPSAHSYLHIDRDDIPHQQTRDRLKRLAQHWRGVTALEGPNAPVHLTPDDIPLHPHATLRPIPPSTLSHSTLSLHSNPSVRPPAYSVHTTKPIPEHALIAPYVSTIVPSAQYLSDPLNSYAHLSMPKPFVHLIGPPLDVALDSRTAGQETRYVRSGCRPNAVLRPVLCNRHRRPNETDDCAETLSFGVFALRDLKANEEVVLGWEWDDGSVIHHLPALIDSPHLFAPYRFEQFRHQMTSMLHAISSTFTTCACGTRTRDCALNRLAEFVDGQVPLPPLNADPLSRRNSKVDLGPLIGAERRFRTREREPMSGGMGGVEMVNGDVHEDRSWMDSPGAGPSRLPCEDDEFPGVEKRANPRRGKSRASPEEFPNEKEWESVGSRVHPPRVMKPPDSFHLGENQLPPKLRKSWIRKKAQALKELYGESREDEQVRDVREDATETRMAVDDSVVMPPPPLPPSILTTPSTIHSTSSDSLPSIDVQYPTTPFANLSLRSPALPSPSHYFGSHTSKPPSEPVKESTPVLEPPSLPTVAEMQEDSAMNVDTPPAVLQALPHEPTILPQSPEAPPAVSSEVPTVEGPSQKPSTDVVTDADQVMTDAIPTAEPVPDEAPKIEPPHTPQPPSIILVSAPSEPSSPRLPNGDLHPSDTAHSPPPTSPTPSSPPRPPSPPKVRKLSVKDVALRIKKRKEEAAAAKPVTPLPLSSPEPPSSAPVQQGMDGKQDSAVVLQSEGKLLTSAAAEPMRLDIAQEQDQANPPVISVTHYDEDHQEHASEPVATTVTIDRKSIPEPLSLSSSPNVPETAGLSYQAKVELTEVASDALLHLDRDREAVQSVINVTGPREFGRPSSLQTRMLQVAPTTSLPRQHSQEDGEILSPPPPRPPSLVSRPHSPRSPPTQPSVHPRSYHTPLADTSPKGLAPPPPPRRPPPPASYRSSYSHSSSSRPLPSAPRALRTGNAPNHSSSYVPPSSRFHPSLGTPRGPSADRDRDWDRDSRSSYHSRNRGRGSQGWQR